MTTAKLVVDPLWQCLCPSWTSVSTLAWSRCRPLLPTVRCSTVGTNLNRGKREFSCSAARWMQRRSTLSGSKQFDRIFNPLWKGPARSDEGDGRDVRSEPVRAARENSSERIASELPSEESYSTRPVQFLYHELGSAAIAGKERECRHIAEILVQERGERPSVQLYNALILSNISHDKGAAWRVSTLLAEMEHAGLQPDVGTCHAVLKVLGVHVDHLLRTDVLDYMGKRWYQLSEDGAHDVTAGLLREGLFEQALERLEMMRREGMRIQGWLLDIAVYVLCEAHEIPEAYRIMWLRFNSGELNLSRSLWWTLLDKASEMRHHPATQFVWTSQVKRDYLNPSSGICLNALATAVESGDAVMATDVFAQLSKRGSQFQPIHYELLTNAYLAISPPDLKRAISVLTIMALEKLEPSTSETRSLYSYLHNKPALVSEALLYLRELHEQGRRIPIAVLNLLIECRIAQKDLAEAMKIYKLIHTFTPAGDGAKKTSANIDTFNLLLKGCRVSNPPDERQASFLVSELVDLHIKPTHLTYDRMILVFVEAAQAVMADDLFNSSEAPEETQKSKALQLTDRAYRHFSQMHSLGWMPRLGTIKTLAVSLAKVGDDRCWDVLQAGEDYAETIDGWSMKGAQVRENVEEAWNGRSATGGIEDELTHVGRETHTTAAVV